MEEKSSALLQAELKTAGFTVKAGVAGEPTAFAETLQKSEAFVAVPTVQLNAATWVPGTAVHSWQAVAAGGMSIGFKGMMIAAKTMALRGADLSTQPATLAAAKAELDAKRGAKFTYETVLGDQKPQLDYRKRSVP